MSIEFFYHISILSIIFFIISSWFKFFLKIRSTLDLSYIWIIIFSTYLWFILNNNYETSLTVSVILAFIGSIPITFLLLFLSSKLNSVYFVIWTLAIYMIFLQIVKNTQELAWWIFWLSLKTQNLIWSYTIDSIESFFWIYLIISIIILIILFFIQKSFFFKILKWWWENELSLKSLWIKPNFYKLWMILLTTFLASLWWNLYWFYHMYIDPYTFWFVMVNIILIISLISYKFWNLWTLIISLLVIWFYEYIRFFKVVDISQIWYFREMVFWLVIMLTSFIVFKFTQAQNFR